MLRQRLALVRSIAASPKLHRHVHQSRRHELGASRHRRPICDRGSRNADSLILAEPVWPGHVHAARRTGRSCGAGNAKLPIRTVNVNASNARLCRRIHRLFGHCERLRNDVRVPRYRNGTHLHIQRHVLTPRGVLAWFAASIRRISPIVARSGRGKRYSQRGNRRVERLRLRIQRAVLRPQFDR